jgi:hypothetical protein
MAYPHTLSLGPQALSQSALLIFYADAVSPTRREPRTQTSVTISVCVGPVTSARRSPTCMLISVRTPNSEV